jgi:hypothetical protein
MLAALAWINLRQMSPCHLWVHPEPAANRADWMKQLRTAGYLGYEIQSLQELSSVLGGRS